MYFGQRNALCVCVYVRAYIKNLCVRFWVWVRVFLCKYVFICIMKYKYATHICECAHFWYGICWPVAEHNKYERIWTVNYLYISEYSHESIKKTYISCSWLFSWDIFLFRSKGKPRRSCTSRSPSRYLYFVCIIFRVYLCMNIFVWIGVYIRNWYWRCEHSKKMHIYA